MGDEVRVVVELPAAFQGVPALPAPLHVVAETRSISDTLDAVGRGKPSIILLVIAAGDRSLGAQVATLVRFTGIPVVCMLLEANPHQMREALVAGAIQVLLWPTEVEALPGVLTEAAGLRPQVAKAAPSVSIAVYGAKGGVGTTRLATELSLAFRHIGQPCLLADLSASGSGPLSLLGLNAERTLGDLTGVAEELTMQQLGKVVLPHPSGLLLASSEDCVWQPDTLAAIMNSCRRLFAVTVWDVPVESYALLDSTGSAFSHVLCVTTADAHALHPLGRRVLPQWGSSGLVSKVQLVINRRTDNRLLRGPDIAAKLHIPLAAEIDELPGLATVSGTAVTAIAVGARRQASRTAQQIELLARSICPT